MFWCAHQERYMVKENWCALDALHTYSNTQPQGDLWQTPNQVSLSTVTKAKQASVERSQHLEAADARRSKAPHTCTSRCEHAAMLGSSHSPSIEHIFHIEHRSFML